MAIPDEVVRAMSGGTDIADGQWKLQACSAPGTACRQNAKDSLRTTIKLMRRRAADINYQADKFEAFLRTLPEDLIEKNPVADAALWDLVVNHKWQ